MILVVGCWLYDYCFEQFGAEFLSIVTFLPPLLLNCLLVSFDESRAAYVVLLFPRG